MALLAAEPSAIAAEATSRTAWARSNGPGRGRRTCENVTPTGGRRGVTGGVRGSEAAAVPSRGVHIEERALMARRSVSVRPLGGGLGCLAMIVFSVLASVLLTVLLNVLL